MNAVKVKEPIAIDALIQAIRQGNDFDDDLCLYSSGDADRIRSDVVCYLDDYPCVINDEDKYSAFVSSNSLYLLYYGEPFKDVVLNVLSQDPQASIGKIIEALNYYMENDNFLDIG